MKKLCLSVLIMLMSVTLGFAAQAVDSSVEQWEKGGCIQTLHSSSNTVEVGTPEIFAIPMNNAVNSISEIVFSSSSTSWNVFLSSTDNNTTPSGDLILQFSETSKTVGSPELVRPRDFYNGDDPAIYYIYATITATTVNTGSWTLRITEKEKK